MSALWQADELAAALGVARGFTVQGISIDTRSLAPGDLFIALHGARDGHNFVAEAFARGASAALVARPLPGDVIQVEDPLAALQRLAVAARARARAKIIAVTGSVGKTTTKEMLRCALAGFGRVHGAEASFNNHIGVPLTLARMPRETDYAVFEIGMNHPGEIAPLARLTQPDVAIITSIGRAHLGLMGSEQAIAEEKATIFAGLAPNGAAVLPAASKFLPLLRAQVPASARVHGFAGPGAVARLLTVKYGAEASDILADIMGTRVKFRLAAPGQHMAENALAVLTVAAALGLDVADAARALEGFTPVSGRGARRRLLVPGGEVLLLDESYNASDASMRAALAVLALAPGRHIAVLGDMLELGEHAGPEHLALRPDALAAAAKIYACGPHCKPLFDSLPAATQGAYASDAAALAPLVLAALRPGDTVLVKGSYGSRMRDVVVLLEGSA